MGRLNNYVIANGRTLGDILGKYTCHQKTGSSVVDYLLVAHFVYKNLMHFEIGPYTPTLSDHCPIFATIRINRAIAGESANGPILYPIKPRYIWSPKSGAVYENIIKSAKFSEEVLKKTENETCPIELANQIKDIIIEAV